MHISQAQRKCNDVPPVAGFSAATVVPRLVPRAGAVASAAAPAPATVVVPAFDCPFPLAAAADAAAGGGDLVGEDGVSESYSSKLSASSTLNLPSDSSSALFNASSSTTM